MLEETTEDLDALGAVGGTKSSFAGPSSSLPRNAGSFAIPPTPLTCELCIVTCKTKAHFQRHLKSQGHALRVQMSQRNPNPNLECHLCSESFSSEAALEIHLHSHSAEQ